MLDTTSPFPFSQVDHISLSAKFAGGNDTIIMIPLGH